MHDVKITYPDCDLLQQAGSLFLAGEPFELGDAENVPECPLCSESLLDLGPELETGAPLVATRDGLTRGAHLGILVDGDEAMHLRCAMDCAGMGSLRIEIG